MQEASVRVAAERTIQKIAASRRPAAVIADPVAVRRRLLAWYARAKRDLPWRGSGDPYPIWVSEIMLQQTQVERVKEFFGRFMARFPSVHALAAAREQAVLKHWEGLGYYRRARQMHAAARKIVAEHVGEFPRSVVGLMSLPGIGRSTAGAIASIAMDLPAPSVEANSRRVLARLAGHDLPVGGAGDEPIWQIAAALVPRKKAGAFNQALMDLGAMICTPDRPLCQRCPVASCCAAKQTGRVDRIPALAAPRVTKQIREAAVVVRHGDRVLVAQRGPGEWWEGLWDFPREPTKKAGDRTIGHVTYTVTHHRIECVVVERRVRRVARPKATQRWATIESLAALPITSPGRRIVVLLAEDGRKA